MNIYELEDEMFLIEQAGEHIMEIDLTQLLKKRQFIFDKLQQFMIKTQRYSNETLLKEKMEEEMQTAIMQHYPNNTLKDFKDFEVVPSRLSKKVDTIDSHPLYLVSISKHCLLDSSELK